MFFYQIYQHTITLNIPLDQPACQQRIPDYTIFVRQPAITDQKITWLHDYCKSEEDDTSCWHRLGKVASEYIVRFIDYADFFINEEKKVIRCYPAAHLQSNTVEHLLLDQVLPRVLSRKDYLVLHAGAVFGHHGTLAFIGETGFGKSTLTAFFGQNGHSILTDDCLVLEKKKEEFRAFPSYPAIRLNRDMAGHLAGNDDQLPQVAEYTGKVRLSPENGRYTSHPKPEFLRAIFILDHFNYSTGSATVSIERLSMRNTFKTLLENTFRLDPTDKTSAISEYKILTSLVACVPAYVLRYERQQGQLKEVLRVIQELFG